MVTGSHYGPKKKVSIGLVLVDFSFTFGDRVKKYVSFMTFLLTFGNRLKDIQSSYGGPFHGFLLKSME